MYSHNTEYTTSLPMRLEIKTKYECKKLTKTYFMVTFGSPLRVVSEAAEKY